MRTLCWKLRTEGIFKSDSKSIQSIEKRLVELDARINELDNALMGPNRVLQTSRSRDDERVSVDIYDMESKQWKTSSLSKSEATSLVRKYKRKYDSAAFEAGCLSERLSRLYGMNSDAENQLEAAYKSISYYEKGEQHLRAAKAYDDIVSLLEKKGSEAVPHCVESAAELYSKCNQHNISGERYEKLIALEKAKGWSARVRDMASFARCAKNEYSLAGMEEKKSKMSKMEYELNESPQGLVGRADEFFKAGGKYYPDAVELLQKASALVDKECLFSSDGIKTFKNDLLNNIGQKLDEKKANEIDAMKEGKIFELGLGGHTYAVKKMDDGYLNIYDGNNAKTLLAIKTQYELMFWYSKKGD